MVITACVCSSWHSNNWLVVVIHNIIIAIIYNYSLLYSIDFIAVKMLRVKKGSAGCNFVHNDLLWKNYVHKEVQTSLKWFETWGCLLKSQNPRAAHPVVRNKCTPPSTTFTTALEPISPPVQKYPHTTAAEIGWRLDSQRQLERFGHLAPRHMR